jgi:prevent-host-death family protein
MEEVPVSQFKAKCLAMLEQVRKTRRPLRITRHGKPVAEIVPPSASVNRKKWLESMRGTVKILGDIVSPAFEKDEWEMNRD